MDRTGRHQIGLVCWLVWRPEVGFYSQSFRFEGGGRLIGLNRTGKSCRLRWVNYLHPGLKRGKMTPQEERLVLDLHAKWGNRWSRIAQKLPGRTDNEIKNYWRTYMRKKAQETKRAATPSSTSNCHFSLSSNNRAVGSHPSKESGEESFYDTGGPNMIDSTEIKIGGEQGEQCYSMDDVWKDIALSGEDVQNPVHASVRRIEEDYKFFCRHLPSPSWEYSSNSLWVMDEEESKTFLPSSDQQFFSSFEQGAAFLTG